MTNAEYRQYHEGARQRQKRAQKQPRQQIPVPSEDSEQITLMSWARMQNGKYPELRLLFAIPNGGSRNKAEAGKLRAMGVKAGVSDLFLPVPRGGFHGLWIEMKRVSGGRASKEQREWLGDMIRQGYAAQICYGWKEASEALKKYLELEG